jgi:histone H3/H4
MTRQAVPLATVKRLFTQNTGEKVTRVSKDANKEIHAELLKFISSFSKDCFEHLSISKKATVTKDVIEKVIDNRSYFSFNFSKADLSSLKPEKVKRSKAKTGAVTANVAAKTKKTVKKSKKSSPMRGLPIEGIIRQFKQENTKKRIRIAESAKYMIVSICTAFLAKLAVRAKEYTESASRQTVSSRDVKKAMLNF